MDRRRFLSRFLGAAGLTLVGCAGDPVTPRPSRRAAPAALGPPAAGSPPRVPAPRQPGRTDWPVYRHDAALTGVSDGVGRITTPEVRWEHYLGAPVQAVATDRAPRDRLEADLDGDGRPERVTVADRTITVTDLAGRRLWAHTVSGRPLGSIVRIARLFRDRPGLQVVTFSGRTDTAQGQGYCFSFHRGASDGDLAWTTGPLERYEMPTVVVDDVDGDGLPEIVTAPHDRVQIFNGQTGALKAEVAWSVKRNYGILLTRPTPGRREKGIYVISDFVTHVDCIRHEGGQWRHIWGHRYSEWEDVRTRTPEGRPVYLRVGPAPVQDLDGDGRDEMVYMLVDARVDGRWHLRVRDAGTGDVRLDVPGVWLWTVADLDADGRAELVYSPTDAMRPRTHGELRVARLDGGRLVDLASVARVRPLLTEVTPPLSVHSIADEGLLDLLQPDLDGDGQPELFYARPGGTARVEDTLEAVSLSRGGTLVPKWRFARPGHRLNLVHAGPAGTGTPVVRVRDLSAGRLLTLDPAGRVTADADLGRPGGFSTTPIVVDLDGDGRNEIVVQTAAGEVVALRPGQRRYDPPEVLWTAVGVAMTPSPGYAWNGSLSPQAADVDGDGLPEVLVAVEDDDGNAALECLNSRGRSLWRRRFERCPWGGLQAGVNLWTFGRFTRRRRGLDVYVDVHRLAKGSSAGYVLRGDSGRVVWERQGLATPESATPFGGGLPAVADVNRDGVDELVQANWTIYAAVAGDTGQPLVPPVFLPGPAGFRRWIAYSSPTVVDLDGDGRLDVYLNSAYGARGGYVAVRWDGRPMWAEFHDYTEGSDGFGPVADFDGDGVVEVAVPVITGTLVCLDGRTGARRWTVNVPVTGDVVAADVNGDGVMELLFAGRDGRLRALSGKDGREIWSIAAAGRPVVADVDGDGLVEVLAVGRDGVLRVIS